MPDLVLWGATTSRTIRAHWALHELGLPYRCEPILPRTGETKTERFTAIAPRQKIPALVDGDFVVAESAAIVAYLSATYGTPETALVPTGARERARYDEWAYFVMTELDATSLYIVRRHRGLPEIYGAAPIAVESALGLIEVFGQRRGSPFRTHARDKADRVNLLHWRRSSPRPRHNHLQGGKVAVGVHAPLR